MDRLVSEFGNVSLERANQLLAGRFVFLNHEEKLGTIDWNKQYFSRLWTYNLHYFDYALDLVGAYRTTNDIQYCGAFESLALDWIRGTSGGRGDAWDPYPTAVRIVNWIHAFVLLRPVLNASFRSSLTRSLFRQLLFLERRIEWHLQGNHLERNLYALFLGSLIFKGAPARRWRRKAERLLWKEVATQVLEDGGHVERSPMYHALVLRDLIEAIHYARTVGESIPTEVLSRVGRMTSTLAVFTRDDASLHLFNDSANGIALPGANISRAARVVLARTVASPVGLWVLPSMGFHGFRDPSNGDSLIIDCGEPGPSYQPGHAHCGLLSYELDIAGASVVVDSGVHGYDQDPFREYVRSTRAHNTLVIDNREQSEIWGTFRIARRARLVAADSVMEDDTFVFRGAYRPYHNRRAIHHRTLRRTATTISVEDVVSGTADEVLESFVHLHPDFTVQLRDDRVIASNNELVISIVAVGADSISIRRAEMNPVQAWYCPEFGKAIAQNVIALRVNRNKGHRFGYNIAVDHRVQ